MIIRTSSNVDRKAISDLHVAAFGRDEGPIIASLVETLFDDSSAEPMVSLVAEECGKVVGHILFTAAKLTPVTSPVSIAILAPLAVHPDAQNRGVGGSLITEGLEQLRKAGIALVFVLGHPGYYPRYGFSPAGEMGFEAAYPIAVENEAAWMVQSTRDGVIGKVKGKVICCDGLNRPEYWVE